MSSRDREMFMVLRVIMHHSDGEVARKSGVSASTIKKWRLSIKDGGTRHPRLHTLRQVAKAYDWGWALVPTSEAKTLRAKYFGNEATPNAPAPSKPTRLHLVSALDRATAA